MKARQFLFHVDCFRCDTCGLALKKGDLFGMYADQLYCRVHYDVASSDLINPHMPPSNGPFTPDPMGHSPDGGGPYPGLHLPFPPPPQGGPGGYQGDSVGWYPPPDFPPMSGGSGGPGDFQYDNNNEPLMKKRRGRKKRKVETFAAMNGYLEASGYPPGMDGQGNPGKTKRARTSFKHHQLRIMKHHFQINQNPDSRELKILSQKTQLDKKVLQVKLYALLTAVTRFLFSCFNCRSGFKMPEPSGVGRERKNRVTLVHLRPPVVATEAFLVWVAVEAGAPVTTPTKWVWARHPRTVLVP